MIFFKTKQFNISPTFSMAPATQRDGHHAEVTYGFVYGVSGPGQNYYHYQTSQNCWSLFGLQEENSAVEDMLILLSYNALTLSSGRVTGRVFRSLIIIYLKKQKDNYSIQKFEKKVHLSLLF